MEIRSIVFKLAIFLCSLAVSTVSAQSICEKAFIRSLFKKPPSQVYNIKKEDSPAQKYAKYESKMERFETSLIDDLGNLEDQMQEIIDAGIMPVVAFRQEKSRLRIKLINKFNKRFERIFPDLESLFEEKGIRVVLKEIPSEYGVNIKVLRFDMRSSGAESEAFKVLKRYKKRFNTKDITYSPIENIIDSSGGFSNPRLRRIDIGFDGIKNLLQEDMLTLVTKHEFTHAAFAHKRVKQVDSVYHPRFISNGEKSLTNVDTGYSYFMSAEEIYTYGNNPFWGSERFGNIVKYDPMDILEDFDTINMYLRYTNRISKQTNEITQEMIETIDELLKGQKQFNLHFYKRNEDIAETIEEAFFIRIESLDESFYVIDMVSPKLKKLVGEVLKERGIIEKEINLKLLNAKRSETQALVDSFFELEFQKNKNEYIEILKFYREKQVKLQQYSEKLLVENQKIIRANSYFEKNYLDKIINQELYFYDTKVIEAFKRLRRRYRDLGDVVKEI